MVQRVEPRRRTLKNGRVNGSEHEVVAAVLTPRLILVPAGLDHLDDMAALHADERVWRHLPSGRHTDREQTRDYLLDREGQWQRDGLGYWVARLRQRVGDLAAGQIAGIGGCAISAGASWWNLYYRLYPEVHGHRLATELSATAISAARQLEPELPVIAFLLEHNRASKATAERAGLTLAWRGADAGNPDPKAVRLIYADRVLDQKRLEALKRIK